MQKREELERARNKLNNINTLDTILMPSDNRFVAVHGFLTDVLLMDVPSNSSRIVECSKAAVDSLESLAAESSSSVPGGTVPNTLDSCALILLFFFLFLICIILFNISHLVLKRVAKLTATLTSTPTSSGFKRERDENEHADELSAQRSGKQYCRRGEMPLPAAAATSQTKFTLNGSIYIFLRVHILCILDTFYHWNGILLLNPKEIDSAI